MLRKRKLRPLTDYKTQHFSHVNWDRVLGGSPGYFEPKIGHHSVPATKIIRSANQFIKLGMLVIEISDASIDCMSTSIFGDNIFAP